MPSTARTCRCTGRRLRPNRITVGVPWPGNVGARRVDDVRQIPARDELLDQLLAELALHERVRRDHADVPGRRRCPSSAAIARSKNRSMNGTAERVLPVARAEPLAVGLVQRRVLHRDVRRVADDDVVLAAEDAAQLVGILRVVDVAKRIGVGRRDTSAARRQAAGRAAASRPPRGSSRTPAHRQAGEHPTPAAPRPAAGSARSRRRTG